MLRFKVHQLQLEGRHYLLLPKLNQRQVGMLGERLVESGFRVKKGPWLTAKSREGAIRVSPSGLCWSSIDPSDAVLPAIPDLLAAPKEKTSLERLTGMYLRSAASAGETTVRMFPRVESSSTWAKLRAAGECGLTPDEREIASFVISRANGKCSMLTDFPFDDPAPQIYGRRRYFCSILDSNTASSTLRVVGERGVRNSYVRRDGTIGFSGLPTIGRNHWLELFAELGEWCFFTPP